MFYTFDCIAITFSLKQWTTELVWTISVSFNIIMLKDDSFSDY